MISTLDIAWLAGLIEGEGSFDLQYTSPKIVIEMTDRDVMAKAARLLKVDVKDLGIRIGATKRIYRIALYGDMAAAWMMTLYALMHDRRRNKIQTVLHDWLELHKKRKLFCRKGHSRKNTKGVCLDCRSIYEKNKVITRNATT